jgi:hypothetical protein
MSSSASTSSAKKTRPGSSSGDSRGTSGNNRRKQTTITKEIQPSLEDVYREQQLTFPFYWDHIAMYSKVPSAFSYTIPVGFYDGTSSDPLASRISELITLQNDTIRREKKEDQKKRKKSFSSETVYL